MLTKLACDVHPFLYMCVLLLIPYWSYSNAACSYSGKSTHTSAETLWLWECKSLGKSVCHEGVFLIGYSLSYVKEKNNCNENGWQLNHVLSFLGKRRTQCILYLLKILSCSRTDIWCHWVHKCYWYLVYRLCDGWTASWTGNYITNSVVFFPS